MRKVLFAVSVSCNRKVVKFLRNFMLSMKLRLLAPIPASVVNYKFRRILQLILQQWQAKDNRAVIQKFKQCYVQQIINEGMRGKTKAFISQKKPENYAIKSGSFACQSNFSLTKLLLELLIELEVDNTTVTDYMKYHFLIFGGFYASTQTVWNFESN